MRVWRLPDGEVITLWVPETVSPYATWANLWNSGLVICARVSSAPERWPCLARGRNSLRTLINFGPSKFDDLPKAWGSPVRPREASYVRTIVCFLAEKSPIPGSVKYSIIA